MVPDGVDGPEKPKPVAPASEAAEVDRAPETGPIPGTQVGTVDSVQQAVLRLTNAIETVKNRLGESRLRNEDEALKEVLSEFYSSRAPDLGPENVKELVSLVKAVLKYDPVIGKALTDLIQD